MGSTSLYIILEVGYYKASTNKIARAADISVGTLYHHFPGGKKDIIRKYFETSVKASVEMEEFMKFDMKNMASTFKGFCTNVLKNHKENKSYHIAFRSAILSDDELSEAHKKRVYDISKNIVKKLREKSDFFKLRVEERLIRSFSFIYNITNAIIYHHIVFMDLFEKDEDLIDYLSNILGFTINYLQKN